MTKSVRIHVEDTIVTLPDGTRLATDVFVLDDGKPHASLLLRTPYSRASLRAMHDPIGLARAGWAVVSQDVRGRWDSSGTFNPYHQEIADGAQAVKWCTEQAWSNGNVAMTGMSYNGATQWLAALGRPKGLRALSPTITSADYRTPWSYEGGAFNLGFLASWALNLASGGNHLNKATEGQAFKLVAREWEKTTREPIKGGPIAKLFPPFGQWIDPANDAFWKPIDVQSRLKSLEVAAYHVAGWYDIFCEGSISAYTELAEHAKSDYVRRSQRLVVGPWTHATMYFPGTGHASFGPEANGIVRGIPAQQLDFLAKAVAGEEVESGVSVFVLGLNRWLELESWPPPTTAVSLYLDGEEANGLDGRGRLSWSPPEETGVDCYLHDRNNPVPTMGGRSLIPTLPEAGQLDQRAVEARRDVLVYTSPPLKAALNVVGRVTAEIWFESSSAPADVTVKVVDVTPEGEALNILDSVRRVDLTPGRTKKVTVDVGSIAASFARDHCIRVEVASSNFPRLDCLANATQRVRRGGRSGSRLILPVFSGRI